MTIREMTIREMITDVVARRQEQVFLVDAITSREITYGEFHRQACALAAELRRRGVQKGDRIGVMVPNCCELAVLYFACIYLGAVIVPINPSLSKGDVQFIVGSCKPALIVTSATNADAVAGFQTKVLRLVTAQEPDSRGSTRSESMFSRNRRNSFRSKQRTAKTWL